MLAEDLSTTNLNYFNLTQLSTHDGPGSRTVLFLQGCALDCIWCHSPHSRLPSSPLLFFDSLCINCQRCAEVCPQQVHEFKGQNHLIERSRCIQCGACIAACPFSSQETNTGPLQLPSHKANVDTLFESLRSHLELLSDTGGITFSGGEPLLQFSALQKLAQKCQQAGIHTAIETSGIVPAPAVEALKPYINTWLLGMRFTTGTSNYDSAYMEDKIRTTLQILCTKPKSEIIVRIPAIPGMTSSSWHHKKVQSLLQEFSITTIDILPYNPESDLYYKAMDTNPPYIYNPEKALEAYQETNRILKPKQTGKKTYADISSPQTSVTTDSETKKKAHSKII